MERILSLDEIRERHDLLWSTMTGYKPSAELQRTIKRQVYKPLDCISYGFAPLAYDRPSGYMHSRRAVCVTCGHVVATNQPSWMAKHMRSKHGLTPLAYPSQLLFPSN